MTHKNTLYFDVNGNNIYVGGPARITCSDSHVGVYTDNFNNIDCLDSLLSALRNKDVVQMKFGEQIFYGIITYIDGGNDSCLTVDLVISNGK